MSNLYQRIISDTERYDETGYSVSQRLFDYLESTDCYAITMTSNNEISQAVWYLKDEMKLFALSTLQCKTRWFLETSGFPKGGNVQHIYDEPARIVWVGPSEKN